jgi:MFS family permease
LKAPVRRRGGQGLGRSYRRLWTASAVSTLGDGVYLAALPLLAAELTSDPLAVSVVTFAGWLPWLLFALPAGALVDRLDRRRVMWMVDAARLLVVGAVCAAVPAGWASIPLLALAGFLVGTGQTLFENAAQSMVVTVVGRDPRRLEQANGQLGAALTVGQQLVGPPAGSAAFALAPWLPFLADSVSFGVSSALVAAIPGRFTPKGAAAGAPVRSLRAEIAEGLRFLLGHRLLRAAVLLVGVSNLAFMAGEAILVLFARQELGLGSVGYGLLLAAAAAGGVPGSLLAARVGRRVPAGPLIVGGVLAGAVAMAVFGLASSPWVAGAAHVATGAVWGVWNVVVMSLRQTIVPDRLMGRVVGAIRLIGFGSIPVGALLGGLLGRTLGLRAPFLLGAAVLAAAALAALPVITTSAVAAARAGAGAGPPARRRPG